MKKNNATIAIIISLIMKANTTNGVGIMHAINSINNNKTVVVTVVDHNDGKKKMKRWGGTFSVVIKNGTIIYNQLKERAWNYEEDKAFEEANNAINFFHDQWKNNNSTVTVEWHVAKGRKA